MLTYAKTVDGDLTAAKIQRHFCIGYPRASRMMELVQAAKTPEEAGAELATVEEG